MMLKHLKEKIYGFDYHKMSGFGDHWALCNYFLKNSEKIRKTVLVNEHSWYSNFDLIKNCLDSSGDFQKTSLSANFDIGYCSTFQTDFCRTKSYWQKQKSNIITYQLYGRFLSNEKNFTHEEYHKLFNFLEPQHKLVSVDNCDINYVIEMMSKSKFFVGIPSGMALVACSVGVPAMIICKIPDDNWFNIELHRNCIYYKKKNVILFRSVDEMMKNLVL